MQKPKVDKDKIEQVIDLEALTGLDLSDFRGLKESIGQALVDRIVERTQGGTSFTGGKLKSPYSKDYQKSLEFKAAGKSASRIDMTLTGDMLASVDSDGSAGSTIRLFISQDQCPKAYNHITGDTVPKRNWFGVTKGDVKNVLADFAADLKAAAEDRADVSDEAPGRGERIRAIDLFDDGGGDD